MARKSTPKKARAATPAAPTRAWPSWREAGGIVGLTLVLQTLVWGLLYEVFGVVRLGYWFFDTSDLGYYYTGIVAKAAQGLVPFRDFFLEYPPLFVPLVLAPGTHVDGMTYLVVFAVLMMVLMAAAGAVTAVAAYSEASRNRAYLVALVFAGLTLLLGPIAANRYDPAVALVLACIILAMVHKRWVVASVLIGVGFALKVTPAMLLPLVLILAPRKQIVASLVGFAAAAAAPFIWVLAEGGQAASNLWQMLAYHLNRPLEVESVLATPYWIGRLLNLASVNVTTRAGSQTIASASADVIASLSSVILLASLGAVFWMAWKRRETIVADPSKVALVTLATLLASLVGSKVLSPQYLVWVIPAVAIVAVDEYAIGGLMAAAMLLTHVLFPANYWGFAQFQNPGPVGLVVVRNLLLVAAFGSTVWSLSRVPADASHR